MIGKEEKKSCRTHLPQAAPNTQSRALRCCNAPWGRSSPAALGSLWEGVERLRSMPQSQHRVCSLRTNIDMEHATQTNCSRDPHLRPTLCTRIRSKRTRILFALFAQIACRRIQITTVRAKGAPHRRLHRRDRIRPRFFPPLLLMGLFTAENKFKMRKNEVQNSAAPIRSPATKGQSTHAASRSRRDMTLRCRGRIGRDWTSPL